MKKLITLSFALIFAFAFSVYSFAYENTVDDGANLFSQSEIEEIQDAIEEFSSQTDLSLAVVTTDDADNKSSMEYADDYHDDLIDNHMWSENSMLFLIDMDNREVHISTTENSINEYSDNDIETIIDDGYDYLTRSEYANCIIGMTEKAQSIYSDDGSNGYYEDNYNDGYVYVTDFYDDEYYYDSGYNDYYDYGSCFDFGDFAVYLVISLIAAAVVVFVVKSKYKNYGKGDEFDEDDITLKLSAANDNVVSRNVITTKIPKNNNRSGGGFSGGGSTHTSSSGRSHGGGGRKF